MSKPDRETPSQNNPPAQPSQPSQPIPPVTVKVRVSSQTPRQEPPPQPPDVPGVRVLVSANTRRKPAKSHLKPPPPPSTSAPVSGIKVIVSPQSSPRAHSAPEVWEEEDLLEENEEDLAEERPPIRILTAPKARRSKPGLTALWFTTSWLSIAALIAGGGWVAVQLIINPGSIDWMQWMFPESSRGTFAEEGAPRSLPQIQAQAKAAGLYLGSPFALAESGDVVIPVSAEMTPCSGLEAVPSASCGAISELRVYRPFRAAGQREATYELVDRLAMPGLEEYFITAPLTSTTGNEGSSRRLPMTTVSELHGTLPNQGIWFQVSGERVRGETRIVYGQVMGYDPRKGQLQTRLQWTSPAAESPVWQDIVAGGTPELVVNQTVGLEPTFQIHQIQAATASTVELKLIDLTEPALTNSTYKNGLVLAQSGLWSPALQLLQQVKDRSQGKAPGWSAAAQAQLDVIRFHAEFTQAQAKRVWANPTASMTALLIDGQWTTALQQFRQALKDGHDLTPLLRDDAKIIWTRVNAALTVNPRHYDVQAWGALTIATKQGRRAAIAWLQSLQPPAQTPTTLDRQLQDILNLLGLVARTDVSLSQSSYFLGTATPVNPINPRDWTLTEPNTRLERGEEQVWYRVQITRLHRDQRWWRSPFNQLNLPALGIANQLWDDLGLAANPAFEVAFWSAEGQFQTLPVTAKAIQFHQGTLHLLAVGDPVPETSDYPGGGTRSSQLLAMTADTLQWVEFSSSLTVVDFNQQQPAWTPILVPTIWRSLQQAGYLTDTKTPTPDQMLQEIGNWSVQLIDLTGNEQPEIVLTVQPATLVDSSYVAANATTLLQTAPPQTVIFLDQGGVIYDELGDQQGQTLAAIATLPDDPLPALFIGTDRRYQLQQWSSQHQRFQ